MLGKLLVSQLVNDIPTSVHYRVNKSQPMACILKQINSTLNYYLFLNINQLDALNFIISLFQASTCFGHMCSKHVEA